MGNVANASNTSKQGNDQFPEVSSKTFRSSKRHHRSKKEQRVPQKQFLTAMHTTVEGCVDKKIIASVVNEPSRMDSKLNPNNSSDKALVSDSENSGTNNKRSDNAGSSLPLNNSSSESGSTAEDATKVKAVWRGPKKMFLVDYRDDEVVKENAEQKSPKSHPTNAQPSSGNTETMSESDRNTSPAKAISTGTTAGTVESTSSKPPLSDGIVFNDYVKAIVDAEVDKTYCREDTNDINKDLDTMITRMCDKNMTKSAIEITDPRSAEKSKDGGVAPARLTSDEPYLKRGMNERQEAEMLQHEKDARTHNNHYAHEPVPASGSIHAGDQPLRKQGRYEISAKEDSIKGLTSASQTFPIQGHHERNNMSDYSSYFSSVGNQRATMEQVALHERTRSAGHFDMTSFRPRHSAVAASSHQGSNLVNHPNLYVTSHSQHQNVVNNWQAVSKASDRSLGYQPEPNRQYSQSQMARSVGMNAEKGPEYLPGRYPVGASNSRSNYPMTSSAVGMMKNRPSAGIPEERAVHYTAREDVQLNRMMMSDHGDHSDMTKYVRQQRQDNQGQGKYPGMFSATHRPEDRQSEASRSYTENAPQGHDALLYAKERGNVGNNVGAYDSHNPRLALHQQMLGSQGQRSKHQIHATETLVHSRQPNPPAAEMYQKPPQQSTNDQRRSMSISYHHSRQSPHAAAAAAAAASAGAGLNRGGRLHVNEPHELARRPAYGSYSESDGGMVPIEPNVQSRPSGSLAGPTAVKWPGSVSYADIIKSNYDATEAQIERMSNMGKRTFPFKADDDSLAKKLNPLVVNEDFRSDGKRAPVHHYSTAPRSGSFSPGSTYFCPSIMTNRVSEEENGALDLTVKPEQKPTANRKNLWSAEGRPTQNYNPPSRPDGEGETFLKNSAKRHEGARLEDPRYGISGSPQWTNDAWNVREQGINHGSAAAAYAGPLPPMFKMLSGPDGSPILREGVSRMPSGVLSLEHGTVAGSSKASFDMKYHEVHPFDVNPRSRANTMDHLRAPIRSFESQYARINSQNEMQPARQFDDNQFASRLAGGPHLADGLGILQRNNKFTDEAAPVLSRTGRRLDDQPPSKQLSIITGYTEGSNKCPVTTSPNIPHLSPIQPLYQTSSLSAPKGFSSSSQIPLSNANMAGITSAPTAANRRMPIVALLGTHDPSDILDLECKLCHSTHGSLRSFRIHFAKAHGLDPTADNFVVHTISDAKNAKIESKSPSSFAIEMDVGNDRDPPALIREAPIQSNSPAISATKHEIIDRPKQIAEVLPMLLSRQPPPPLASVTEHSAQCRKDSGDDSLMSSKQDDKGAQCMRCQWLSTSQSSSHNLGPVGTPREVGQQHTDAMSGEAHCKTCMEGFRDISDCREHMLHSRIHVSSSMHMMRSCACKACDLGFTHAEALRTHLLKMHPPEEIANVGVEYRCLFCPAAFSDAEVLYRHTDEHERDYTSRHIALGTKSTGGGLRKERNFIQMAIPDTTCLDDQRSVTSEHSSTKSPDSNNDGENRTAVSGSSSLKRKHSDSISAPTKESNSVTSHPNITREPRAIYSSANDKPTSRKYSAVEGLLRDSTSDSYTSRSSFSYGSHGQGGGGNVRNQGDNQSSSRNSGNKYSEGVNSDSSSSSYRGRSSTSVSDYTFGTIRSAFYNRPNIEQLRKMQIENNQGGDVGKRSSSKDQNAHSSMRSGDVDKSCRSSEAVLHQQERMKIEQQSMSRSSSNEDSSKTSSGGQPEAVSLANKISIPGGIDQNTDSIHKIIESLVAAEVKRTMNQHPSSWSAAIDSMTSLPGDSSRNRAASFSFPMRPTTSTEYYLARFGDEKGGDAKSTMDVSKNPTTAQLLREDRSCKPSTRSESISFPSGQSSSLRAHLQGANTNQICESIKSETTSESLISKLEGNPTSSEGTPLLRDIVSKMNQTVESNLRGLSDNSTTPRGRVDSLSGILPGATAGRTCVRDVCDAIIAQSFRDDGTKRSPDHNQRIKSRISSIRDGIGIGRYAFSDSSRHSSMSAGSIASGGAESPRSTSTTDDDKLSISARDRLPAKLLNVDSPADSPRSSQRSGLTLKELMGSPAIARNYRFDGLSGKSSANTVDWTNASEGPRTERRRSEENASITNYLSDEGSVEQRRRNQTFSAGNSISNTSSSTQNLERLVASAEARKLLLRTIHEKQQRAIPEDSAETEKDDSSKSEGVPEKKSVDATLSSSLAIKSTKDVSPIRSDSLSSSDDDEDGGRRRKLFIDETRKSNHDDDDDDDASKQSQNEFDKVSQQSSDLKQTGKNPSAPANNQDCRNVIQNNTRPLTRADSPQLL